MKAPLPARALPVCLAAALLGCAKPEPPPAGLHTVFQVAADANGAFWDAAASRLYISDQANDRLMVWKDGQYLAPIALPAGAHGLGQVARLPDGTLAVARFGGGQPPSGGGIAIVDAGGASHLLAGVDATRHRLGLAVGPDGTLLETWITDDHDAGQAGAPAAGAGKHEGGVAAVGADGQERDVATGLAKPTGLAVAGDGTLYVAEQGGNRVLTCALPECKELVAFAEVPTPDQIAVGAGGALFVSSTDNSVYMVDGGKVTVLKAGYDRPRGLTWDPGGRLFLVDKAGLHTLTMTITMPAPSPPK